MNRQARGVRRVSVRLNPDTIKELDAVAKTAGVSRSGLVSRLVREALGKDQQEKRA